MFKILLVAIVAVSYVHAGDKSIKAFNDDKIPQDLGITVPSKEMKVEFTSSKAKANYGNNLKLSDIQKYPYTEWQVPEEAESAYFTLVAIDLDDANSRDGTGYILWLVNNITIANPTGNEILAYQAPRTAGNRIAFFVFYQSGVNKSTVATTIRKDFDLASYAKDSSLTDWAGNFFLTA